MMNNCTVRFYIGLLFHVMGAVALADYGLRMDSLVALAGAAALAATAAVMSFTLRDAAFPSRAHAGESARRATASSQ